MNAHAYVVQEKGTGLKVATEYNSISAYSE